MGLCQGRNEDFWPVESGGRHKSGRNGEEKSLSSAQPANQVTKVVPLKNRQ